MSDLYDTHEQGERVKNWLRENGSAIVMGLVLAFGLMFGFKQWQIWETSKRQQASAEYQVMGRPTSSMSSRPTQNIFRTSCCRRRFPPSLSDIGSFSGLIEGDSGLPS